MFINVFINPCPIAAGAAFFLFDEIRFGVQIIFPLFFIYLFLSRPVLSPQALFFCSIKCFWCKNPFLFLMVLFLLEASPIAAGVFVFVDKMRFWGYKSVFVLTFVRFEARPIAAGVFLFSIKCVFEIKLHDFTKKSHLP